jgi:hemerythrin-like domain-containing protein
MLTATYTLVALSVELASVRLSLLSFQKYVRSTLMQQNSITLSQLEYACENLNSLYQACHWRKTEIYLIPAIRQATERADHLLDELSRLNQSALLSIRMLQERLGVVADVRDDQAGDICASIETFCTSLLKRLEKEEQELFVIARAAIAGETWFSIANQLMMHDKRLEEMKRSGATPPESAPAARTQTPPAPARRLGEQDRIGMPGMQVLPIVNVDGAGHDAAPSPLRPSVRYQPLDDALTK